MRHHLEKIFYVTYYIITYYEILSKHYSGFLWGIGVKCFRIIDAILITKQKEFKFKIITADKHLKKFKGFF